MENTSDFIKRISDFFDQAVGSASDDALFAQGYLRGHIDLAVGQLEVAAAPFAISDIVVAVDASLAQAVAQGELSELDKTLVLQLWQQLH